MLERRLLEDVRPLRQSEHCSSVRGVEADRLPERGASLLSTKSEVQGTQHELVGPGIPGGAAGEPLSFRIGNRELKGLGHASADSGLEIEGVGKRGIKCLAPDLGLIGCADEMGGHAEAHLSGRPACLPDRTGQEIRSAETLPGLSR